MGRRSSLTIVIPRDISAGARDALLDIVREHAPLYEPTGDRNLGELWTSFVAVMGDVEAVAGGASAAVELAKKLLDWRREVRERGIEPKGRLEQPGRQSLDLSNSSDEELLAWLIEST